MAKIGLRNFRYAELTGQNPDGTPIYGQIKSPGKAVTFNASIESYDGKFYADDALAESFTGFKSGTFTMELDRDDASVAADLLGHTFAEGELTSNIDDKAPYIGIGRIVTEIEDGATYYKGIVLYKCKAKEPSEENTTRGDDVEFASTSYEGDFMALNSGNWRSSKRFNTLEAARTYVDECLTGTASQ